MYISFAYSIALFLFYRFTDFEIISNLEKKENNDIVYIFYTCIYIYTYRIDK